MAEVAEALVFLPLLLEILENRDQRGDNFGLGDFVFVDEIEAIALDAASEENGVFVFRFSDQADVGIVGPGTAVGAAGHSGGENLVGESKGVELFFELIDQGGQQAFAFGDR